MLEPEVLGAALRLLRTQRRLQQKEVARRAGITGSMLSGYEQGRRAPTLVTVEKILRALGCGLTELVAAMDLLRHAAAPELAVRDGPSASLRSATGASASSKSPSGENMSPDQGVTDLDTLLGVDADELPEEARRAFSEMLQGYHRWLRFLVTSGLGPGGWNPRRKDSE